MGSSPEEAGGGSIPGAKASWGESLLQQRRVSGSLEVIEPEVRVQCAVPILEDNGTGMQGTILLHVLSFFRPGRAFQCLEQRLSCPAQNSDPIHSGGRG